MSQIHFDSDEVDEIFVDLTKAPNRMQRRAPAVFRRGAVQIKAGMRDDASGHDYLGQLPYTINYDELSPLDYEIGYDKVGQGNLAVFAAFGSINNAPVLDLNAPLRRESRHVERHLGDEGESAVLARDAE